MSEVNDLQNEKHRYQDKINVLSEAIEEYRDKITVINKKISKILEKENKEDKDGKKFGVKQHVLHEFGQGIYNINGTQMFKVYTNYDDLNIDNKISYVDSNGELPDMSFIDGNVVKILNKLLNNKKNVGLTTKEKDYFLQKLDNKDYGTIDNNGNITREIKKKKK